MRDFKSGGEKSIQEAQKLRARKLELERVGGDIAVCKKKQEKLRQSEQRFRSIFDNANDIIGFVNTTGKIIEVNKKVADILGYKPDELVGKNFMKCGILQIKNAPTIIRLFKELVKRRELPGIEGDGRNVTQLALRHKKGHTVFVEASTTAIKTDRKLEGFLSVLRDINERKQAEEALRESQRQKQAILDSIPDIAWLKDKEGRYLAANEPLCKAFGVKLEDLVGKTDFDISPEDLAKRYRTDDEKVMKSGKRKRVEEPWGKKKGKRIWIETIKTPIYNDKGEVVGTSGIARDITERKRAKEKIEAERKKLETYIEAMVDGVSVTDANGVLIQVNKALAKIHNYSPQEMVGKRFIEFVAKRDIPKARNIFVESIKKKKHVIKNLEITGLRKDGSEFSAMLNIRNLWDKEGKLASVISAVRDITERKQAEQALRESEERYRAIFEQAADPIVLIDPKTAEIVEFNDMAHEDLGYTREEFGKLKISDLEAIESPKEILKHAEEIVTGGADNFETKKRTKSGEVRDYQVNARAITLRGRDFIQSMWYDTTERKKAEEALRESEEKLRSLVERANDGIAILQDGVVKYVNPRTAEITGYTVEEMVNTPFTRYVHPDEIPKLAGVYERRMAGEEIGSTYETVVRHKDGSNVHVEINAGLLTYEGKPADFAFARDITGRKRAEQKLRESKERLKILFEYAPDGIYLSDLKGNFVDGNKAAEELVGFKREELIGKNLAEVGLLPPGETLKAVAHLEKVANGEPAGPDEFTLERKDGSSISVEIRAFPVRIKDQILSLGIARDITERKYSEQRLLQEQAKLKSLASQLTLAEEHERRRIAAELHDRIGQSLAISKMNLEALRKSEYGKETDETLYEICSLLAQTIADTRTLTFDLSSPILYELGFEAAVAEWLAERIQDNRGIATQFENDGRPKPLDDDIRILLFRNVRELLINVVKHARAHKVKVSIRRVGRQISVSVEDDGVGFDPAVVAPTAAKRAEFGLFSIRQRLEELGGHLEIDSEPGLGCMVTMTAPLKQD